MPSLCLAFFQLFFGFCIIHDNNLPMTPDTSTNNTEYIDVSAHKQSISKQKKQSKKRLLTRHKVVHKRTEITCEMLEWEFTKKAGPTTKQITALFPNGIDPNTNFEDVD